MLRTLYPYSFQVLCACCRIQPNQLSFAAASQVQKTSDFFGSHVICNFQILRTVGSHKWKTSLACFWKKRFRLSGACNSLLTGLEPLKSWARMTWNNEHNQEVSFVWIAGAAPDYPVSATSFKGSTVGLKRVPRFTQPKVDSTKHPVPLFALTKAYDNENMYQYVPMTRDSKLNTLYANTVRTSFPACLIGFRVCNDHQLEANKIGAVEHLYVALCSKPTRNHPLLKAKAWPKKKWNPIWSSGFYSAIHHASLFACSPGSPSRRSHRSLQWPKKVFTIQDAPGAA